MMHTFEMYVLGSSVSMHFSQMRILRKQMRNRPFFMRIYADICFCLSHQLTLNPLTSGGTDLLKIAMLVAIFYIGIVLVSYLE